MHENAPHTDPPMRLVKARIPTELVRRMDAAIVTSSGSYLDRAEFLADGIRNLLEDLNEGAPVVRRLDLAAVRTPETPASGPTGDFGDWTSSNPATLPAGEGPATNFGMHNRDLPTLWAIDWLGRLVAEAGGPVSWETLNASILPAAWNMALILRSRSNGGALKAEAGFPSQPRKRDAAERRFLTHFAGTPKQRGPWFVFRLVGIDDAGQVAPTAAGVGLVRDLRERGFANELPLPAPAWQVFKDHLEREAPEELGTWIRVLTIVGTEPTRTELAERVDWWSGSQADTNSSSYVARGREWGLVEPALIDGHYRLTEVGRNTIESTPGEDQ